MLMDGANWDTWLHQVFYNIKHSPNIKIQNHGIRCLKEMNNLEAYIFTQSFVRAVYIYLKIMLIFQKQFLWEGFFRKELSIAFGSLKFYWIYTPVLAYEESLCWVSMHMCLQYKCLNQTSALTACRRQLTSASFLFSSLDILVCGPDETRLAILGADVWQFGFVVRRCSPPQPGSWTHAIVQGCWFGTEVCALKIIQHVNGGLCLSWAACA